MSARAVLRKRPPRRSRGGLSNGIASDASAIAQIPNALTVGRLILIPVFVGLVLASDGGHSWPAAIVFGAAGVTDQIDGWLARLWRVGRLPWVALAIPARDLALLAGYKLVVERGYDELVPSEER